MYDAFGNLAAEYGGSVVSPCGVPTTCYLMTDHLGSTRLMTDNLGSSTNVKRYDYLPFGEEIVSGVNGRSTSMGYPSSPDAFLEKFTGQARDPETANVNSMTGLDWMRARYYSSSQGRFQSVDPANAGASVGDPQSWNGYAYVGNNPLNYRDPSGTILEATTIGAATGNPIGVAVGLGVDVFCALFCGKLFGGPPSLPAPKITGNGPEVWSERAPISSGGANHGGVYGSGCGANGICSFQTSMSGMAGLETEWWRMIRGIELAFQFKRTPCSEEALKDRMGNVVGGKAVPFFSLLTAKDDLDEFVASAKETLYFKGGVLGSGWLSGYLMAKKGSQMTQVGNAATTPFATYGADLARKGEALTSAGNGTMKWASKISHLAGKIGTGATVGATVADAAARMSCR